MLAHSDSYALRGMKINLQSAGHVAGAKITTLQAEGKQIVYTGDFCFHDTEILQGCRSETIPENPDVLITECTYGGKVRLPRNELINQFLKQLLFTMKNKGNVLIPTFAFHRSQEMAKRIDTAIDTAFCPVTMFIPYPILPTESQDTLTKTSRCSLKKLRQQNNPFYYQHVKHIYSTAQIDEPAIVICTSGFGHAGASLRLLANGQTTKITP